MKKKYIYPKLLILLLTSLFVLIACSNNMTHQDIFESIEIRYSDDTNNQNYVTSDIEFHFRRESNIEIVITSLNEEVITIEDNKYAIVKRGIEDFKVTINISITYQDTKTDFPLEFKVIKAEIISSEFIVEFNSNGGSLIESQVVMENAFAVKPEDPIRLDYIFVGWYIESLEFNFNTPITSNITLVAKWEENSSIIYELNLENSKVTGGNFREFSLAESNGIWSGTTYRRTIDGNNYLATNATNSIKFTASDDYYIHSVKIEVTSGSVANNNIKVFDQTILSGIVSGSVHDSGIVELEGIYTEIEFIASAALAYENITIYLLPLGDLEPTFDLIKPEITLDPNIKGSIKIAIGEEFIIPQAYAFDNKDGDLTDDIIFSDGDLNTQVEGVYTLTWRVKDFSKNEAILTLLVIVTDDDLFDDLSPELTSYYGDVIGLSGLELKAGLSLIIQEYKALNYETAKTVLEKSDRDPNNSENVIVIYSGNSVVGPWTPGNHIWAREHIWPNSHLGVERVEEHDANIASDLHNLRPIDPSINSSRGNKPFLDSDQGEYGAVENTNGWYPGDEFIGDVARIVFYMNIMWDLDISLVGTIETFIKWHYLDPVDDFERNRNEIIYQYQENRNPFIDLPELVFEIYGNIEDSSGKVHTFKVIIHKIDLNMLKRKTFVQ